MTTKEKVYEFIRGTYGQSIDQIVAYFEGRKQRKISKEAAEHFVAELIRENRVYEFDPKEKYGDERNSPGPFYHAVIPEPAWVKKMMNLLDECLCEAVPFYPTIYYIDVEDEIEITPSFYDLQLEDGTIEQRVTEVVYDFKPIIDIFTKVDNISVATQGILFSIEGEINGERAWVNLVNQPHDDSPSVGLASHDGSFREYTDAEIHEQEHGNQEDE